MKYELAPNPDLKRKFEIASIGNENFSDAEIEEIARNILKKFLAEKEVHNRENRELGFMEEEVLQHGDDWLVGRLQDECWTFENVSEDYPEHVKIIAKKVSEAIKKEAAKEGVAL